MSAGLAARYRREAARHAGVAERLARAVLDGRGTPEVLAELREENRRADLYRKQAAHLTPAAWVRPRTAPWRY